MELGFIRFISPTEGDVLLTDTDGEIIEKSLKITIIVEAPEGAQITINGIKAEKRDGCHIASILIDGYRNRIEAVDALSGNKQTITVFWFRNANGKYRFTVDDFIIAMKDITENKDKYRSIFENPYLKVFKQAYDQYGSKVHINLFYENLDGSFNLSMMTDRFKEEFIANADWMTLTFHARREFPDEPYKYASYETVMEDCRMVTAEIQRFAGKEVLSDTTTLHWGASNIYGSRALRSFGFKALSAYLTFDVEGNPWVSYHLNKEQVTSSENRDFWVDTEEDIIFAKLHIVLNALELTADRVEGFLDELAASRPEQGFIQMVIHEQYFYSDYENYEPDYAERILNMAKWMKNHGYEPVSLSDIIREN